MTHSWFRPALALVAGGSLAACTPSSGSFNFLPDDTGRVVSGSFEETLDVRSQVTLEIVTQSGAVTVRRGRGGQVRILGTIAVRADRVRDAASAAGRVRRLEAAPPIRVSGDRIRIGWTRGRELPRGSSVGYEIEAPADTIVRVHTGSGRQDISGFAGRIEAQTGAGRIRLSEIRGTARVRTGSGRVLADGIEGSLTSRTGSGRVEVTGVVGALYVQTASGDIRVEGEVHGQWDLQSRSGSIEVDLPPDAGFNLDARAGRGRITINHPIALLGRVERNRMRGQVRDGGSEIRLQAGSGPIVVD